MWYALYGVQCAVCGVQCAYGYAWWTTGFSYILFPLSTVKLLRRCYGGKSLLYTYYIYRLLWNVLWCTGFPHGVTLGKIFIYIDPFYLFLGSQWQYIELDNSFFIDKWLCNFFVAQEVVGTRENSGLWFCFEFTMLSVHRPVVYRWLPDAELISIFLLISRVFLIVLQVSFIVPRMLITCRLYIVSMQAIWV